MITQADQLAQEIKRAKVRLGPDAPIVRALQQQLDGYRLADHTRQQRWLTGTVPAGPGSDVSQDQTQEP